MWPYIHRRVVMDSSLAKISVNIQVNWTRTKVRPKQ